MRGSSSMSLVPCTMIPFLLLWSCLLLTVDAWSFVAVQSGECGAVNVTWQGGNAPYTVGLHAIDSGGRSYSVDSNAYQNGQGFMQFSLPVAQGKQFVVTMGDTTGALSGGASAILTADARPANIPACDTTPAANDFYWTAPENKLYQCQSYDFTQIGTDSISKITRPTTLYVIIPGGAASFTVPMGSGTSFDWTANVIAGTTILFDMVDSQGHQGGADQATRQVLQGNSGCGTLHSSLAATPLTTSITSTATSNQPATTTGSATNAASTASASSQPKSKEFSTGAIAGIAVGGAVLIGLIALLLFLLFRKRDKDDRAHDSMTFMNSPPRPISSPSFQDPRNLSDGYRQSYYPASSPSFNSASGPGGWNTSPRVLPANLQHTDIAEVQPLDIPLGLPPQYTGDGSASGSGSGSAGAAERWTRDSKGTTLSYGPSVSPSHSQKFGSGTGNW